MRQTLQVGDHLFVIYPKRNQVWIFGLHFHIGCLSLPQMEQVLRNLKAEAGADRSSASTPQTLFDDDDR